MTSSSATQPGLPPARYYPEANDPMTVFGLNLAGFMPGLLLAAALVGLGWLEWCWVVVMLGFWLARKMAVDERYFIEVVRHIQHGHRWMVPPGEETRSPVTIVPDEDPRPRSVSSWLNTRILNDPNLAGPST